MGDTGTSAARQLHVAGTNGLFRLDRWGTSAPGFLLANMNNGGAAVEKAFFAGVPASGVNNGYFYIGDYGTQVSGTVTRRFVIDNDGDVIIGTSTSNSSGYKLRVEGAAQKTSGGSNWNVLSDKRLKSNINNFDLGLGLIMEINPVEFDYNGKAGTISGDTNIGVVAQELQKIAPFMVDEYSYTNDGGLDDVDGIKEFKSTTNNYLSVNPSAVKWLLVNAVKEQQEMIELQSERIEKLEEIIDNISSTETINSANVSLSDYNLAELNQNIPNPFTNSTIINYTIPSDSDNAEIRIFSNNGKLMQTVSIDHLGSGSLNIDASSLSSGTYSYNLVVDGRNIETRTMVVTK